MLVRQILSLLLTLLPGLVSAEWLVMDYQEQDGNYETRLAYSSSHDNHTLEIYRDTNNAIRTRFSIPAGLTQLFPKNCPTFQIDRGQPRNRSINDAPCIANSTWVEFIFGYTTGTTVASSALLGMMNGNTITFRYKLSNGDYRETSFSLMGSKRALTEAIGQNVTVIASQ